MVQQDYSNNVNAAFSDEELITQLWGRLLGKIKTETILWVYQIIF